MRHLQIIIVCCVLVLVALEGCKVGPDYQRPDIVTPDGWRERVRTDTSLGQEPYWRVYDDAVLHGYIKRSLDSNLDLLAVMARIEAARAQVTIANSGLFPTLGVNGDVSGFANSENRYPGVSGDAFLGPTGVFGLMATLSWELDVFGRIRRGTEAQRAQLRATEEAYRASRVSIVSAVSETYITLRQLDMLKEIIDSNLASRREYERLAKTLFEGGKTSELDWRQAEGELRRVEAELPVVKISIAQTENALNVLLGRQPGLAVERGKSLSQQNVPTALPSGLPSQLIERRPDVVAAERRVATAFNRVAEAKAARLPKIALTANASSISSDLFVLQNHSNPVWGLGANLVAPIFNGYALQAQVEIKTAEQKLAVAEYGRIGARVFGEVEAALSAQFAADEREAILARSVAGNARALELAQARYKVGSGDLRGVLQQNIALYGARVALVRVQSERRVQRVNLYLALGGGFEVLPPAPEAGPVGAAAPGVAVAGSMSRQ